MPPQNWGWLTAGVDELVALRSETQRGVSSRRKNKPERVP